jgi:hypothetical protein
MAGALPSQRWLGLHSPQLWNTWAMWEPEFVNRPQWPWMKNNVNGGQEPSPMDPIGRFDWIYRFTTLLIQRHQFFSGFPGAIVACLVAVLIYPTKRGHDFDPWLSVARLRTAQGGHRFWCSASVNLWRGQWLKIIDPHILDTYSTKKGTSQMYQANVRPLINLIII